MLLLLSLALLVAQGLPKPGLVSMYLVIQTAFCSMKLPTFPLIAWFFKKLLLLFVFFHNTLRYIIPLLNCIPCKEPTSFVSCQFYRQKIHLIWASSTDRDNEYIMGRQDKKFHNLRSLKNMIGSNFFLLLTIEWLQLFSNCVRKDLLKQLRHKIF